MNVGRRSSGRQLSRPDYSISDTSMKNGNDFKKGFVIGVLAGAFGAVALYKKRGAFRAKLWRIRAKMELHHRLRELKALTRRNYDQVVDDVITRARVVGGIAAEEAEEFAEELKQRFDQMRKTFAERADDDEDDEKE